jgi:hypothetical protein
VTAVVVASVIAVTLWQLHLNLLLTNTTTTGGDTGAHFIMPAYLWTLITHGQLTGWDPAWFAGFPIYTFYFILPDLFAAVGSQIVPYGIAFKWVTVLGSITLPISAWFCGKQFRLKPPIPAVLAAATLPFLFDYTFTIYGGNLFSTLAGEYPFSFSLSLAVVFIGIFARGIRTGKYRGWAALVLCGSILAHIVPAWYAMAAAGILTLFELLPSRWRPTDDNCFRLPIGSLTRQLPPEKSGGITRLQALWWGCSTVALGVLLSGWWLVPFASDLAYSNSMGYQNLTDFKTLLFPEADWWAIVIAGLAMLLAIAVRSRFGLMIGVLAGGCALGLIFDPLGALYNVRLLPLWILSIYLAAGWGFGVVASMVARWWRRLRLSRWAVLMKASKAKLPLATHGRVPRPSSPRWPPGAVGGALVGLIGVLAVVVTPFVLPANDLPTPKGANQVSNWAQYNYVGYEGQRAYPEYRAVMKMMKNVGSRYGCGRAMWEYNPNEGRFGTTMALMLLPYWTGGCIDSMEGLLFESSATTPYHFLNQAELSVVPSEPMVGLPYGPLNVQLGVEHLQMLGVKYFMAFSPEVVQAAKADPALKLVDQSGPWISSFSGQELTTTWSVFEVKNSSLVEPLANDPAVLRGVGPGQPTWLAPSVAWYEDPARWSVYLASGGPRSWPRVGNSGMHAPVVPARSAVVSGVRYGDQSISFDTSRTGTPILVKISYFPNWHAHGARGPWRVTPNLMVVVPTSHRVTLTYGATPANYLGIACTAFAALALLVASAYRRLRHKRVGT